VAGSQVYAGNRPYIFQTYGRYSLDTAPTKRRRKFSRLRTNTETIDGTKNGNEGNSRMLQNHSYGGNGDRIRPVPAWIHLQTKVLLAVIRMRPLSAKHSARMADEGSKNQDSKYLTPIKSRKRIAEISAHDRSYRVN
jgi:hypothetical protein